MLRLIFGCGYLGERVAARWHEGGDDIVVVTRSTERADGFKRQGYGAIVADVSRPETLTHLPTSDTVLFAVGYDRAGGQSIMDVYASGVRNVLDALPVDTGRFVYISTTGVYGSASGDWVDEQTPPDPQRDGGRASLAAEKALAAHRLGGRGVVLRLAGIYGPGRVPFLKELRAGEPIPAPSTGYLNLIHVDDAASVVVAAAESGPRRVYCVSDGHPVERGDFYREVARLLDASPPRFVEPDPDSPRAARARADRRVRNDKILSELRVTLAYPDYRAGLAAVLETRNQ
ncbi:MAG: NAD-dependent epimerase/dehydratase family protein [Planctomycetes bacterium]|nr:NAD-dependent epimerase/dehydratase family protein [Planctomycetota bacterium]